MRFFSSRQLALLGLVTLAPRALVALLLGVVGRPEWWEYDVIAAGIVNGEGHVYDRLGFMYAAYAPPLWSYLLAALTALTGGARVGIQITQALCCFASAVVYASLAHRLTGNQRTAMVAGLFVAVQPSLLYYSVVKSDPLPLSVLLLGLIALAGVGLMDEPTPKRAALFGFLLAAGVLAKGTPIVGLPLVAFGLAVRWKRAAIIPILIMLATLALALLPWLIRNSFVLGRPLITSTAGENFWRGNHEGASGGVLDRNGGRVSYIHPSNEALPPEIRSVLMRGTELQRQDIFLNEAWRFIRESPGAAVRLFARKISAFWWKVDSDPDDYPPAASLAYDVVYRAELILGLLGAFAVFRTIHRGGTGPDRTVAALALGLMVGISLLQSAFYVQGRHRFLIEPLLLIFTAAGIADLVQRIASTAYRSKRQSGS